MWPVDGVIYVREDNDNESNVQAMIIWLIWTTWTSLSAVQEMPLNLITHSFMHVCLLSVAACVATRIGNKNQGVTSIVPSMVQVSGSELGQRLCGPELASATQVAEILRLGSGSKSAKALKEVVTALRPLQTKVPHSTSVFPC